MDNITHATDDPDRMSHLIRSTLKEVWTAYYAWEQTESNRVIKSLARPQTVSPIEDEDFWVALDSPISPTVSAFEEEDEEGTFVVHNFDTGRTEQISCETEILVEPIPPCMPYESCAPMSQNLHVGDDSSEMPFIPLADDPTFDVHTHLKEYTSFAWQRQKNPDSEYVCTEICEHGLIERI